MHLNLIQNVGAILTKHSDEANDTTYLYDGFDHLFHGGGVSGRKPDKLHGSCS